MANIATLIDLAKDRTGANYSEIAQRLDRSKQLISNWRRGEKVPADSEVIALARMAGEDADPWLAVAQAARTTGPTQARWESIARKLGIAAAVALCAIGTANYLIPMESAIASVPLMFVCLTLIALALRPPEAARHVAV